MGELQGAAGLVALLAWFAAWMTGGIWMAQGAFRLRPNETLVTGLAAGLVVQTILANLLARVIPLPLAFWLAALLVLAVGGLFRLPGGWRRQNSWRSFLRLPASPAQWVVLLGLVYVAYKVTRGLAIFDDYAHLPTTSLLAAGDIPPHFSLNPSAPYGYHYFLMLFAAQLMRVGGLPTWEALDLSRALSFALAVLLAALWTQRVTRSRFAGALAGAFLAFGSGTRWALLLLPGRIVNRMSAEVQMLGSGAASGADLSAALGGAWAVEGGGPLPFPFAFANGIFSPGVLSINGPNGLMNFAVIFLLLLTFNRWVGWRGGLVTVFFVASLGLLTEVGLVVILGSFAVLTLAALWVHRRSLASLARGSLGQWWLALAAGGMVGVLQGGAFTDLVLGALSRLSGGAEAESYQTIGFGFAWPPVIVSSHLGALSLFDPLQLLLALLELGPVILVIPLLAAWGLKAFRLGRWYEAALVLSGLLTLGMALVRFTGSTGLRNTSRLYEFVIVCAVFAVPLAWLWIERRARALQLLAGGVGLAAMFGGLVIFGVELLAAQTPIESYFITAMDRKMYEQHWDQLEAGALVFDSVPYRAPTLFGRATRSSLTWYQVMPEWELLHDQPGVVDLRDAGFDYVYLDQDYWDELEQPYRARFEDSCVKLVGEVTEPGSRFRRLLDIRGCSPLEPAE